MPANVISDQVAANELYNNVIDKYAYCKFFHMILIG